PRRPGRRRHARGYTLIEFMMTLGIVATLVGLAMPSIQRGISTQELNDATLEIMHLVDFTRIQAQSRNRAYEIRLLQVGASNGTLQVNESSNTRCDGFGSGLSDVRVLDLATADYDAVRIVAASPGDFQVNSIGLCFKPDGRVIRTDTRVPVTSIDTEYSAGEAWIDVQRATTDNNPIGRIHRIVIPYNGVPRREYP
ncbi:MAG: prepilin-type N-terminal cleavage/methylation domain-containing protein, partial [Myxococcota bacterium]